VLPAHGRAWGKGNFPLSVSFSLFASASDFIGAQNRKFFLHFFQISRAPVFLKKERKIFRFESPDLSGRGSNGQKS